MRNHIAAGSAAVDGEDGDASLVGLLDGGHNRIGIGGIDQQGIDAFLDQVLDVGGLLGRIILRIHHDELDARIRSSLLRPFFQGDEEGVVQSREGETDGDLATAGRCRRFCGLFRRRLRGGGRLLGRRCPGARGQSQRRYNQQDKQDFAIHLLPPF